MRVLNYTGAMLTFLNYRTNCARRQRKFITGTAKMEPGGEWICCCCPADALLISVLHYKHPIWHSPYPFILSHFLSSDCRFFFLLTNSPSCFTNSHQGVLGDKLKHTPGMASHKLIWHFILPLMRHLSVLTHSEPHSINLDHWHFFLWCILVSILALPIAEGRFWCLI